MDQNYTIWNGRLSSHFFGPHSARRRVYLQVDADLLAELAGDDALPANAELSFVHAVRSKVRVNAYSALWPIEREISEWKRERLAGKTSAAPPYIALLALTVLAASHMRRDDDKGIGSSNYYRRLNELLNWDHPGKPPGYEIIENCWHDLNDWLTHDMRGTWGLPTAQSLGHLSHIGYPLSQCLLRDSDRAKFPDFFRWAELPPRTEIDPAALEPSLDRWCSTASCRFSTITRNAISLMSDARTVAARAAADALETWSGESVSSEGQRQAGFVLAARLTKHGQDIECNLFAPCIEGFPDGAYTGRGATLDLQRADGLPWFEPLDADIAEALLRGLHVTQGKFTFEWRQRSVVALVPDGRALSAWVSASTVPLGEPVLVLCQSTLASDFEQFLASSGGQGTSLGRMPSLPGWEVFSNVLVPPGVEPSIQAFGSVVPGENVHTRLDGGFKLERDTWMLGWEPDWHIVTTAAEGIRAYIDGRNILSLPEREAVIPLRDHSLGLGSHTLAVPGGTPRTIFVEEASSWIPDGEAQLAYELRYSSGDFDLPYPAPKIITSSSSLPPGTVIVRGAAVSSNPPNLLKTLPKQRGSRARRDFLNAIEIAEAHERENNVRSTAECYRKAIEIAESSSELDCEMIPALRHAASWLEREAAAPTLAEPTLRAVWLKAGLRAYEAIADAGGQLRTASELASIDMEVGRACNAVALLDRVVTRTRDASPRDEVNANLSLAAALSAAGQGEDSLALLTLTQEQFGSILEAGQAARLSALQGVALSSLGRDEPARRELHRAVSQAEAVEDWQAQWLALKGLIELYYAKAELPSVQIFAEDALKQALLRQDVAASAYAAHVLGRARFLTAKQKAAWEEARTLLRDALAYNHNSPRLRLSIYADLADLYAACGLWEEAVQCGTQLQRLTQDQPELQVVECAKSAAATFAQVSLMQAQPQDALNVLGPVLNGTGAGSARAQWLAAQALHNLGRTAEATEVLEGAPSAARLHFEWRDEVEAMRMQVALLFAQGRDADGELAAAAAFKRADRLSLHYVEARIHETYARALRLDPQTYPEAIGEAQDALDAFRVLGAADGKILENFLNTHRSRTT